MMNIFLLFLTTLFMIGYYVIFSPSQNLTNMNSENVVQMSNLRSIAECVIGMQNAKMNDEEFKDSCVEKFGVVGEYVCANAGNPPREASCEGEPYINYIISRSNPLDEKDYGSMLEIIERYYPDKGTFGIYDSANHNLMTTGTNGRVDLNTVITGPNADPRLQNGQLVYVMQYQIPYMYEAPEFPGCDMTSGIINTWIANNCDPVANNGVVPEECSNLCANCPADMIPTIHYNRWMCVELNSSPMTCPAGTQRCESNPLQCCTPCENFASTCPEGTVPDCDNNQCIEETELECPEGCYIKIDNVDSQLNETLDNAHCVCPDPNSDDLLAQCTASGLCCSIEEKFFTIPQISVGPTARRFQSRKCDEPCYIQGGNRYNPETNSFDVVCVPNITQREVRRCSDVGDVTQCNDKNHAMYFGFKKTSNTDCIPSGDGNYYEIVFEKIKDFYPTELQDGKWHCMECPNGVDVEHSMPPYVTVCKP